MAMIGTSRPSASLSSSLLARKGQARPAMRPQGFVGVTPAPHDDLGWNDMGDEIPAPPPPPAPKPQVLRQREALSRGLKRETDAAAAPASLASVEPTSVAPEAEPLPATETIFAAVAEATPPAPAAAEDPAISPDAAARVVREVRRRKRRAAFTLRLDPDRHLRLRLASAVSNRSAQQLVTEALDAFLDSQPDVGELVRRLETGGRATKGTDHE
jgi:hypothetical protein